MFHMYVAGLNSLSARYPVEIDSLLFIKCIFILLLLMLSSPCSSSSCSMPINFARAQLAVAKTIRLLGVQNATFSPTDHIYSH